MVLSSLSRTPVNIDCMSHTRSALFKQLGCCDTRIKLSGLTRLSLGLALAVHCSSARVRGECMLIACLSAPQGMLWDYTSATHNETPSWIEEVTSLHIL